MLLAMHNKQITKAKVIELLISQLMQDGAFILYEYATCDTIES